MAPRRQASKSSPRKARAVSRQQSAIELRRQGYTFEQIAKRLGCSLAQAHGDVTSALKAGAEQVRGTAVLQVQVDLERLDGMLYALRSKVAQGNLGAIDKALRILERRAKLLGLDGAIKVELTGKDGGPLQIDDARTALATAIARALGEAEPDAATASPAVVASGSSGSAPV